MSFWDNLREAIQQLGCYLDILMYLNRPTFYTHSYALGAVGSRRWWWGPKIVQALGAKVCDKRSQIVHFSLPHVWTLRWLGYKPSWNRLLYLLLLLHDLVISKSSGSNNCISVAVHFTRTKGSCSLDCLCTCPSPLRSNYQEYPIRSEGQ